MYRILLADDEGIMLEALKVLSKQISERNARYTVQKQEGQL